MGGRLWSRFWLTAGWVGYCPWAPGTFGSLVGLLLALAVCRGLDRAMAREAAIAAGLLLFSGMTLLYGDDAEATFGRKDPPQVVSDEVAGMLLSVLLLPSLQPNWQAPALGAGFLLFRLFDILKPPPLKSLERLAGGWGVLLDDLGAGLMANAALQLLLRFPLKGLLASPVYQGL